MGGTGEASSELELREQDTCELAKMFLVCTVGTHEIYGRTSNGNEAHCAFSSLSPDSCTKNKEPLGTGGDPRGVHAPDTSGDRVKARPNKSMERVG